MPLKFNRPYQEDVGLSTAGRFSLSLKTKTLKIGEETKMTESWIPAKGSEPRMAERTKARQEQWVDRTKTAKKSFSSLQTQRKFWTSFKRALAPLRPSLQKLLSDQPGSSWKPYSFLRGARLSAKLWQHGLAGAFSKKVPYSISVQKVLIRFAW